MSLLSNRIADLLDICKQSGRIPNILYNYISNTYKNTYFKGYQQPCGP